MNWVECRLGCLSIDNDAFQKTVTVEILPGPKRQTIAEITGAAPCRRTHAAKEGDWAIALIVEHEAGVSRGPSTRVRIFVA